MAKKTSSAESSLKLYEVLESEFEALHDKLPADYPRSSGPETRLKAICSAIHALPEKRAALCISGGGIRSATFGLGILQGLARCGLLDKFHYLSTVSGGGYIGSWLSAWIKNDQDGIRGVVGELKRRPDSMLDPEPRPMRHLREFSNYLSPRAGLTSVDFWTLITTFVRNMFLNWLVLISWLAAAMMIPRLYLAAIMVSPNWDAATDEAKTIQLIHWWNFPLNILLTAGFALIAVAMAYSIIDVPSTGNARLSQRSFLKFRQLPLVLASLALAEWWALFRTVHGSDLFQPREWLLKFVVFFVSAYVCGGLLGTVLGLFRKREQEARPGRVSRVLAILLASAFAGFCLWAMATRMFLDPKQIEFTRECEARQVPSGQTMTIPNGTKGQIKEVEGSDTIKGLITEPVEGRYIIATPQGLVRIAEKDLNAWQPKFKLARDCQAISHGQKATIPHGTKGQIKEFQGSYIIKTDQGLEASIAKKDFYAFQLEPVPDPKTNLTKFTLLRDCEAKQIPSGQKTTIPPGTKGQIKGVEGSYIVQTDQGLEARIAEKDLDAFQLNPVPDPAKDAVNYICFAPALIMAAVLLLVNFLFTGLASWVTEDEDREWWARSAAWILITIFGWVVVNVIVLWGAQAISATTTGNQLQVFLGDVKVKRIANALLGVFGGTTGIVGALLALRSKLSNKLGMKVGFQWPLIIAAVVFFVLLAIVISWGLVLIGSQPWVHQLLVLLGQAKAMVILGAFAGVTVITGVLLALRWKLHKKLGTEVGSQWPLIITVVVFFVALAVVISWALLQISSQPWVQQLFVVFLLTLTALVVGIGMGFFINANKFSLHATYRNRLIRAYLAASRPTRNPSRFTGFDPADNFELCELPAAKPLHIINGALNLVKGEQLAWQERKAESFTMSRLHCGCSDPRVGYRPSAEYGRGIGRRITLGTAMAISGAAANPNMGYHSSPVVGFLMTLFNVRLGWWLGNPGPPGAKTWRLSGPRYSVGPLFNEAVGNTTHSYKYVNLSDGGHFENLGLYEMVLRRCHYIVVSDGGQDPECSFADLGEAVRKIRIDFGIPIEFGPMSIYPRSAIDALKARGHDRCAIGRIRYSMVDGNTAPDGVIVYIKPVCYGVEPRDIYEYFKRNADFPHESTADQFFSESQFESYRMLGAYTMEKLCTDCRGDFRCFIRDILKRHLKMKAPDWLAELLGTKREWLTRLKFSCRKLQK